MKHIFLASLASLALLASCTDISTDPAPARNARTATTVQVSYLRTASTITADTMLVDPRLDIFVVNPTVNADGSFSYPPIAASTTPTQSITNFTAAAQTVTLNTAPITVQDGVPSQQIRMVLSSANRPGRRANSQRLTASLLINTTTARVTATHTGTNFGRTAPPNAGTRYATTVDANLSAYLF